MQREITHQFKKRVITLMLVIILCVKFSIAYSETHRDYVAQVRLSDPRHYSKAGMMMGFLQEPTTGIRFGKRLLWIEPNIQMLGLSEPIFSMGLGLRQQITDDYLLTLFSERKIILGCHFYFDINHLLSDMLTGQPVNWRILYGLEMIIADMHFSTTAFLSRDLCKKLIHEQGNLLSALEPLLVPRQTFTNSSLLEYTYGGLAYHVATKVTQKITVSHNASLSLVARMGLRYDDKSNQGLRAFIGSEKGTMGFSIQYHYTKHCDVSGNVTYDTVRGIQLGVSVDWRSLRQHKQMNTEPALFWKPTHQLHLMTPSLESYVTINKAVKVFSETGNTITEHKLASMFQSKTDDLVIRKQAARLWLFMNDMQRNHIVHVSGLRASSPFEIKLQIAEECFKIDSPNIMVQNDLLLLNVAKGNVSVCQNHNQNKLKSLYLTIFLDHLLNIQQDQAQLNDFLNIEEQDQAQLNDFLNIEDMILRFDLIARNMNRPRKFTPY